MQEDGRSRKEIGHGQVHVGQSGGQDDRLLRRNTERAKGSWNAGQVITLGINVHHEDSREAITEHGSHVATAKEERFARGRRWAGFPQRSYSILPWPNLQELYQY